jgi:thiol-disulfide isomerase/thioredoxin
MRPVRPLVALVVVLSACSTTAPPAGPAVEQAAGAAPVLQGRTLRGTSLSPDEYAGRVLVVNLWATWCGPCEREQPVLAEAARDQGPKGAFFLGIDERDDPAAALAWLDRYDVPYPSLADPSGYLAYRFGAPFLPVTVIVDADGRLRFRVVGEVDRRTIDRLIDEVAEPA